MAIGVPNSDIWVLDPARDSLTRLTFDPGLDDSPVWTPDGKHVTFRSNRSGQWSISSKPADGSGAEERLTSSEHWLLPGSWSPDGRVLSFLDPGGIWVQPLNGEEARPFIRRAAADCGETDLCFRRTLRFFRDRNRQL